MAKAIRKKLYGEKSRRSRRYARSETGMVIRMDLGGTYRRHKRAWNRLTKKERAET
ncbi:MAG: hypothetical protein ABIJ57_01035 [Pseudomonadota bacterium]